MKQMLARYVRKIADQHLAAPEDVLFFGLDAELVTTRETDQRVPDLARLFDLMNINSLLCALPAEPYRTVIRSLIRSGPTSITPADCETRTFFHDIPVISSLTPEEVSSALGRRKAAISSDGHILSAGTISPEQAFISFSSVCFSTFVKFFADIRARLTGAEDGEIDVTAYRSAVSVLGLLSPPDPSFSDERPRTEEDIFCGIAAAGRALVRQGLVDSYFGNISYIDDGSIAISQTGSSLDELEGAIDVVPLDGSSSAGITASSELSAHIGIYRTTGCRAILHGHPKFTVIMSMSCRRRGCDLSTCYRTCREPRSVLDIPVVSGEIGRGPSGLYRTVPAALSERGAAIVYGHGIFAAGRERFTEPFHLISGVERQCREACLEAIETLLSSKI